MIKLEKDLGFVLISDIFLGYKNNKLTYVLYFGEPYDDTRIYIYIKELEKNESDIKFDMAKYSKINKLVTSKNLYDKIIYIENELNSDFYIFENTKTSNGSIKNFINFYINKGEIKESI